MTKQIYLNEIGKMTDKIVKTNEMELINKRSKVYANNLNGRHYIHNKATKQQLEGVYEGLVNIISDHRL